MCRSHVQSGGSRSNRRCKGKGQVGAAYTSDKLTQSFGVDADVPTYSEAYQEERDALSQIDTTPEGVTEGAKTSRATDPVDPQDFDNFHRVVSKMINKSDMTEHDKRIARKQWAGAKEDVAKQHVNYATLSAWQKVMAGTALAIAEKIPDERGSDRIQWRQMTSVLNDRRPIENFNNESIIDDGLGEYASKEEFDNDFPEVEPVAPRSQKSRKAPVEAPESHDEAPQAQEAVAAPTAPVEPAVSKQAPRVSSQAAFADDDYDDRSNGRDDYGDYADNDSNEDSDEDEFDLDKELASYDNMFKDSVGSDGYDD